MSITPLFSVVIPTHNRALLLEKAISSVLMQTCTDWELLVVDDGSKDNTKPLVSKYVDARITYLYQEHQERSTARNLGIQYAKGTYICFLDDDDYFLSHHLKTLEEEILEKDRPVSIFRTGMLIDRQGKQKSTPFYHPGKDKNPILFFLNNMVGIHTLCFHRQILQTHRFDTRWMHFQDTHLFVRCLLDYPFFQINDHTCVYRLYDQMGSWNMFRGDDAEGRTENNVAAIRDLFRQGGERLLQNVPTELEDKMVCLKYLQHANGALRQGKRELAWRHFERSINVNRRCWFIYSYVKFFVKYWLYNYRFCKGFLGMGSSS